MKISMIIQYTILFSLRSLTIEAAISSSSTTSGSIRGSAAAAINDSIVDGGDGHRESKLYNSSSSKNDGHRLLQVATDVSMFLDCMISMRAYRYHIFDYTNTNFYFYISLQLYSPLPYFFYSTLNIIGSDTLLWSTKQMCCTRW